MNDVNLKKKNNLCKVNYSTYTQITQNTYLQTLKQQRKNCTKKQNQLIFPLLLFPLFLLIVHNK